MFSCNLMEVGGLVMYTKTVSSTILSLACHQHFKHVDPYSYVAGWQQGLGLGMLPPPSAIASVIVAQSVSSPVYTTTQEAAQWPNSVGIPL